MTSDRWISKVPGHICIISFVEGEREGDHGTSLVESVWVDYRNCDIDSPDSLGRFESWCTLVRSRQCGTQSVEMGRLVGGGEGRSMGGGGEGRGGR